MISLAWVIFAGVIVALLFLNFFLVKYFDKSSEKELFPVIVATLSLTLTLLCIFLIPVDIYSVSSVNEYETTREVIRILYMVLYCSVLGFSFGVIPFACFYYEAYDPEEGSTFLSRVWDGLKYTFGLLIIVIVLFITGVFLRSPNEFSGTDPPDVWAQKLLGLGKGTTTISFAVACITLVGYVVWCTYTAYGLAILPIDMIRGRKSIKKEEREIQDKLEAKRITRDVNPDGPRVNLLSEEERVLSKRADRIKQTDNCCYKCFRLLRPFSVLFGIIFFIISILIVVSIGLTALDRTLHHIKCDATCGYILSHPKIFNPFDELLILLSGIFPVDYVIVSLIVLFIYFATGKAVTDIGIRFFCLHMFSFRRGRTEPQALMTASIVLMLSILALNNSIVTLAPTYATFGSQTYIPDKNVTTGNSTEAISCSLNAPQSSGCKMTQVAQIVNGVNLNIGFFGIAFYGFTCLFVLAFFVSIVISLVQGRKSNIDYYSDDDEESEDFFNK